MIKVLTDHTPAVEISIYFHHYIINDPVKKTEGRVDELSEKFQTAFDPSPPPLIIKRLYCNLFQKTSEKGLFKGPKCIYVFGLKMTPPRCPLLELLRKSIQFGSATLVKTILRCFQINNGSSIKTDHYLPTEGNWRHRNWGKALSHHQISYLGIEIIIKLFFYRIILLLL